MGESPWEWDQGLYEETPGNSFHRGPQRSLWSMNHKRAFTRRQMRWCLTLGIRPPAAGEAGFAG